MTISTPVRIASATFYWKPAMAWFRSLELDAYRRLEAPFESPVLDIGCGDGRVARMLEDLGVLDRPPLGVDLDLDALREARLISAHRFLVHADVTRLPFKSNSFRTIVANGFIGSVPCGPEAPLSELHRVLGPDGMLVATLPTDRFLDMLLVPRMLVVAPPLRRAYENRMNKRVRHYTTLSPDGWRSRLVDAGFQPGEAKMFLSRLGGRLWNLAGLQVFRVTGILKLVPHSAPARWARTFLARALGRAFEREVKRTGLGFMLISARKEPSTSVMRTAAQSRTPRFGVSSFRIIWL
jgi:SAM-dependent methyltransferase